MTNRPINPTLIAQASADFYHLDTASLTETVCRVPYIRQARDVAIFLSRNLTPMSYPVIAKHFAYRDPRDLMRSYKRTMCRLQEGGPASVVLRAHLKDIETMVAVRQTR